MKTLYNIIGQYYSRRFKRYVECLNFKTYFFNNYDIIQPCLIFVSVPNQDLDFL